MTLSPSESPWSIRALAQALRAHVLGVERGLLGRAWMLLRHPGATMEGALGRRDEVFGGPLRLFLFANVVFFLVGPSVGLLAFTLDSLAQTPGYAEVVEGQIARLGLDVPLYRERFNGSFRFRQPTFVILLSLPLAVMSKLVRRREPFGRHLVFALLFLAWVLLAWPAIRVLGLGLGRAWPGPVTAWGDGVVVTLLFASTVVALKAMWSRGFGRGGLAAWGTAAYLTGGLLACLAAYGHLLFWLTWVSLEWGL